MNPNSKHVALSNCDIIAGSRKWNCNYKPDRTGESLQAAE